MFIDGNTIIKWTIFTNDKRHSEIIIKYFNILHPQIAVFTGSVERKAVVDLGAQYMGKTSAQL